MRILYLLQAYPKISLKFILDEMIAVEGHGHDVRIIAMHDPQEGVAHQEANRFPVRYFDDLQQEGVVEFVKDNQIDHIHSHFASAVVGVAHRVHRRTGVPFSFTTHAFDLYKRPHEDLREWCTDAKCVFTISEYNKNYMCRAFGADADKIGVVRCGVFPERLVPRDYSSRPFRIITACRLVEKKGLRFLISACNELKKRGIAFACEIVGDGDEDIQHLIDEFGLSGVVTLQGSVVHPEIVDFIRSGSVFVLPCVRANDGDQDGIPAALMEAMALRIPVVSTTLSGIPELVSNRKNGLLVTPGSVGELVNAILEIRNDESLVAQIRGCSRERIQQSYCARPNAKKMITALEFDAPVLDDFDLPPIRFCRSSRDDVADLCFEGLSNVFNPSFHIADGLQILTFRAIPQGDDRLTSYIVVQDEIMNISSDCLSLGCLQLIDPKVFHLDDGIYVTFNSGHVGGGNDIFVMKVYPRLEKPKRIIYEGRKNQERNWSFFCRDGEIYALYWVSPLKLLKLGVETDDTWEFEEWFLGQPSEFSDITIGTQLAEHEGRYYFMGHRKYTARGKKLYLGRSCCLDFSARSVVFGRHWFAHSPGSLHGHRIKHNNNLFSCTYFSGIQIVDGEVVIGYGVNDVDYGFSRHSLADFMGNEMADIFGEIYEKRMWGGKNAPRFYSGRGSNDDNTQEYRNYVQRFIQEHNITSVLDVGCGDFRLGRLMNWDGLFYKGVDVIGELISENNNQYASENITFLECDIATDELPSADLCLVRQVFQHFSNGDILSILPKLTKFTFVLITDGLLPTTPAIKNIDKPTNRYNRTGDGSGLYLESPPFNVDAEVVLSYPSRNKAEVFRTLLVES